MGSQTVEQLEHRLVRHLDEQPSRGRMARGRDPLTHLCLEFLGRQAGMGGGNQRQNGLLPASKSGLDVASQNRAKGLLSRPLGVLRRQRPHALDGEEQLEIRRLLGPQGAVVVEHRDALSGRTVVGMRRIGGALDEVQHGRTALACIPRGQRTPKAASAQVGEHEADTAEKRIR